jgi:hypothetical protein
MGAHARQTGGTKRVWQRTIAEASIARPLTPLGKGRKGAPAARLGEKLSMCNKNTRLPDGDAQS